MKPYYFQISKNSTLNIIKRPLKNFQKLPNPKKKTQPNQPQKKPLNPQKKPTHLTQKNFTQPSKKPHPTLRNAEGVYRLRVGMDKEVTLNLRVENPLEDAHESTFFVNITNNFVFAGLNNDVCCLFLGV